MYILNSLSTKLLIIISVIMLMLVPACGSVPTAAPTVTATNSPTLTRTPTPNATETPKPTATSTPQSELATPRWMILGQPGYNVEILDETWFYYNDGWSESHAWIRYQQNDYERFFEQCFAIIDEDVSNRNFDGILDPMLANGFEEISLNTNFPNIDRVSLSGARREEDRVIFFEIVEAKPYFFVVEMSVTVEEKVSLQDIYEEYAADVMDHALLDAMQKSRVVPKPSPTPMSPEQESNYIENGDFLISESEANDLYGGRWELLDDHVWKYSICREFEDRTNADVLWVSFANCVSTTAPGATMQDVEDFYLEEGDARPETKYAADNYIIHGYGEGHLYYSAIIFENGLVFRAIIETRSMVGTTAENGFTEAIDEFLHAVLMENLERSQ